MKLKAGYGYWMWADDDSPVVHPAGVLLIMKEQWNVLTDNEQAQFKLVFTNDGLSGRGIVLREILHVRLA